MFEQGIDNEWWVVGGGGGVITGFAWGTMFQWPKTFDRI